MNPDQATRVLEVTRNIGCPDAGQLRRKQQAQKVLAKKCSSIIRSGVYGSSSAPNDLRKSG